MLRDFLDGQQRLHELHASRLDVSGLDALDALAVERPLRWRGDRLTGDLLPGQDVEDEPRSC